MSGKRKAGDPATPRRTRRPATSKTRSAKGRRLRRIAKWLALLGLLGALLLVGVAFVIYRSVDLPAANAKFETETSFIYYAGGEDELGQLAIQNRERIPLAEMPQDMKDAVVAIENPTFWTDNGIDPRGILRAAFSNARGNQVQGGSTITQQYIKVLYLNQERSYTRKIKEAVLSLKTQRQFSKEEILDGYLNTIYFGNGSYGVQAAARTYFQKPAAELDLRETAALAAVLNNPSLYDPYEKDSKKRLRDRTRIVLDAMADYGAITTEEADQAGRRLARFPAAEVDSTFGGQKGHALTLVKDELTALGFTDAEIEGGGLRVTTTLTRAAMTAVEEGVLAARPEAPDPAQLHVGAASVEPGTGRLLGFYAGQDYLESQINWAVAGGQAGSILKPFALAAALKDGYTLNDTFQGDSPIVLDDGTDFENQGDSDYGTVDLIQATEDSINTAFIDLTDSMDDGPQKIIDMMTALGIPPNPEQTRRRTPGFPNSTPGLEPFAGVALGSATVSPINMATAYATLANGGVYADPYLIEKVVDRDGSTVYEYEPDPEQVVDAEYGEDITADVTYAMQQVVESGSGTAALELDRPAAGKTGTSTNDDGDVVSSWFAGFTPQVSTAVVYVRGKGVEQLAGWLPDDDGTGDGYFGGTYPAQTWTAIMQRELEGVEEVEFPEPAYVDIDTETGQDDGGISEPEPESDSDSGSVYVPPAPQPTREPSRQPSPQAPENRPSDRPDDRPTRKPDPTPTPTPVPVPEPVPPPTQAPPGCTVFDCPSPPPSPPPSEPTPEPTTPPAARRAVG